MDGASIDGFESLFFFDWVEFDVECKILVIKFVKEP